ncbi:MAG: DUF1631 family protein [Pseudomonadota bacterium]
MNQRKYPRYELECPALIKFEDQSSCDGTIQNYSVGGLFIECKQGLPLTADPAWKQPGSAAAQIIVDAAESEADCPRFSISVKAAFFSQTGFGVSFVHEEHAFLAYLNKLRSNVTAFQQKAITDSLQAITGFQTIDNIASAVRRYLTAKLQGFISHMESELEAVLEKQSVGNDQAETLNALNVIKHQRDLVKDRLIASVSAGFESFKPDGSGSEPGRRAISTSEMDLVEKDDFDEWVEVVRVSRMIDANSSLLAFKIEQGLAFVARMPVSQDTNPVSPYYILWSIRKLLDEMGLGIRSKKIAYESARLTLLDEINDLYEELVGILEDEGVETETLQANSQDRAAQTQQTRKRKKRSLFSRLTSLSGADEEEVTDESDNRQSGQLVGLDQVMGSLSSMPYSHYLPLKEQIQSHLSARGSKKIRLDKNVVAQIDATEQLITSIKQEKVVGADANYLLERIKVPFLQQVLSDSQSLENPEHPARKVFDVIGELSLYNNVLNPYSIGKTSVSSELEEIGEGVVSGKIADMAALHSHISKLLEDRKQGFESNRNQAVESCDLEINQQEFIREVRLALKKKLENKSISSALDRVLQLGWPNLLVQTLTEHGEESKAWLTYIKLIDVLLVIFQQGKSPKTFKEEMVKDVSRIMRKGFSEYPVHRWQAEAFIEEFERSLFAGGAEMDIWMHKRIEVDGDYLDNILPMVQVEHRELDGSNEKLHPWQSIVDGMKVDDWIVEPREQGQVRLINLAWKNLQGSRLIFVDGSGFKALETDSISLARGLSEGKYSLLEDKEVPMVERAVQRVLEKTFDELREESDTDRLTGLKNRRAMVREIARLLKLSKNENSHHCLITMDVDKFRVVNEICGLEGGDRLLQNLVGILRTYLPGEAVLARTGDNEFGILIKNCVVDKGYQIAETQRRAISNYKFNWNGESVYVTASMGITLIDNLVTTPGAVIANAGNSCSLAKSEGQNCTRVYQSSVNKINQQREMTRSIPAIEEALSDNKLLLYCQKITPLFLGEEDDHYEILLRIFNDEGEAQNPVHFIKVAEENNRMRTVDRWVLKTFFKWLEEHKEKLDEVGAFTINLSGQSLSDPDFLNELKVRLKESSYPMDKIGFEITETAVVKDIEAANLAIKDIQQIGCSFLLDDFGSGYSSFSYLKDLQVDYVKIDGIFIKDILEDESSHAMVKGITEISQMMGKKVIAEYVENDAVINVLRKLEVDFAQGYGIGRPFPLSKLTVGESG